MVVQELDGVLDRDHVLFAFGVDLVKHRGKRRGLTRACRPGDKNEAARLVTKVLHHKGQTERVKTLDFPGDGAEKSSDCTTLIKNVSAEPSEILQTEREVEFQVLFEAVLLRVRQNAIGQRLGIRGGQRRHIERPQAAVEAHAWRAVGCDVKVAPSHLNHFLEQFAQCYACHCESSLQDRFAQYFLERRKPARYLDQSAAPECNHALLDRFFL